MAFRGFDAAKLRALAGDLDRKAGDSAGLHSRLATLLTTAQQNLPPGQAASRDPDLQGLVGDLVPMPSFFGGRRRLPGSLQSELGDMQGSMKRRVRQMEGLQELEKLGYPVSDGSVFLDEKPPDPKKIDDALRNFQGLRGTDFGTNGNRDDLERIAAELDGLSGAELDVFMSKASPDDLAFYNELLSDTSDSGWNPFDENGLPEDQRRDTLSLMLSRISPQNVAKFQTAFPDMQPTFTNTGAYESGGNDQNGLTNNGIHWAPPRTRCSATASPPTTSARTSSATAGTWPRWPGSPSRTRSSSRRASRRTRTARSASASGTRRATTTGSP